MKLTEIRIRNFRNFSKNTITFFNDNIVVLGENGSGKTNLFRCIRLILDKRYRYVPNEKDFPISLVSKKGHWIILQAKFTEVDIKKLGKAAIYLNPQNGVAWINYFFRPGLEIRDNLVEICEDVANGTKEEIDVQNFLENIDIKNEYGYIRTLANYQIILMIL